MDQIPRQRRPSLSIELSPLIDCVFLLLIFFMLSSTMLAPAIDLDLPDAAMASEVQAPEVVVTVDRRGQVLLNARRLDLEELAEQLVPLAIFLFQAHSQIPSEFTIGLFFTLFGILYFEGLLFSISRRSCSSSSQRS